MNNKLMEVTDNIGIVTDNIDSPREEKPYSLSLTKKYQKLLLLVFSKFFINIALEVLFLLGCYFINCILKGKFLNYGNYR